MRTPGNAQSLILAAVIVAAAMGSHARAAEPLAPGRDGWQTWRTDAIENRGERCCFRWSGSGPRRRACDLDRSRGNYGFVDGFASYSGEVQVYVLMDAGAPTKVTVLSPQCEVRTDTRIMDLGRVGADRSVDWLQQYIRNDSRLTSDVLAAVSLHGGERALEVLIAVVESKRDAEVRKEAIFWLVQSGSKAAFDYIDRLLTSS